MEETGYTRLIRLLLICTILINCNNKKVNGDDTSNSVAESKKKWSFFARIHSTEKYSELFKKLYFRRMLVRKTMEL